MFGRAAIRLGIRPHSSVFYFKFLEFLANVNSCSRSLYAVARLCRLSVLSVCKAHAPYSAG